MVSTTKKTKFNIKKFSNFIFTFTIFFTSCCFIDALQINLAIAKYDYKWLKILLSFVLPTAITVIHYIINHNLLFIADRTATVMVLFSVLFVLDSLTFKVMWSLDKTLSLYHLTYGLETFFSVFVVMTLITIIRQRNKEPNNHYVEASRAFFSGATAVLLVGFFMIYIVTRYYNSNFSEPNFIPFQGEMSEFIKSGAPELLVRDAGNVMFFTAMAIVILEFAKRHRAVWGFCLPVVISISMEFYQYFFKCGDPDIDDVILNALGAILGCVIYKFIIEKIKENELCWESLEQWMWR